MIIHVPRLSKEDRYEKNLIELKYELTQRYLDKLQDGTWVASDAANIIKLLKEAGEFSLDEQSVTPGNSLPDLPFDDGEED